MQPLIVTSIWHIIAPYLYITWLSPCVCIASSVIWLTRVHELSDSHTVYHMMILCFSVQYCWSERKNWRKKRHKGLSSICSRCRYCWYERWKWEEKRDTKYFFSKHMLAIHSCLWSEMGMSRKEKTQTSFKKKEETQTSLFQAYANLPGMSFPHLPSS